MIRTAAIVANVVAMMMAAVAAQPPAFRTGTDAVRVDVAVTRGGRAVEGLTAADFELRDSGVLQQIDVVSVEEIPLDLVFALDTSFSVRGAPLEQLETAAREAIAGLRETDRSVLLSFSHVLHRRESLTGDLDIGDGGTALNDAAYAAMAMRRRSGSRALVLLFTDGRDTASWMDPLAVIDYARRSDVVVVAVVQASAIAPPTGRSVRDGPILPGQRRRWFLDEPQLFRAEFLPTLAEETGGEVVTIDSSRRLRDVFVNVLSAFRARYALTYAPKGVPPGGWHPLDVRTRQKADIRARRGYMR